MKPRATIPAPLATALTVNALTGSNYGFLSARPPLRSMLDLFSDTHWLYVLELNLLAFVFSPARYRPWSIAERWNAKKPRVANGKGMERRE